MARPINQPTRTPPNRPTLPTNQALYYLSGLTCTDENFVQKGFAQRQAAQRGLALIAPDTRYHREGRTVVQTDQS